MREERFAHFFGFFAAAFLAVFLGYPLVIIFVRSFQDSSELWSTLTNTYYYQRLGFTLYQALLSTFATVLLALPSAFLFARYDFWGKRVLRSLFLIPFVMPTVVVAIGFLALFGPRGLIPIDLRNTLLIIILAHVFYNFAIVVRMVSGYLEGLGNRLYEAAQMLGSSRLTTLMKITVPIALPAVLAAATLVFIFCFSSFGVILILTPEIRFRTLEVEIYQLSSRLLILSGAAYLVILQFLVISFFSLLYTRLQARLAVSFAYKERLVRQLKGRTRILVSSHFLLTSLLLLAPLVLLVVQTFWQNGDFGLQSFHYALEARRTIGFSSLQAASLNSLRFALISTVISLVVGFAFAYAVVRAGWTFLDSASLLPLSISAVTLGLAYLLAFPGLRSSVWGISLSHSIIAFPFVTRSILPALRSFPGSLIDAAQSLGASPLAILWRIELPLLLPAFVTAASFALAISMGEFAATLTLQNPKYATLPVAIFDRLSRPGMQNYGAALALACLLMLVTGLLIFVLERYSKTEF
ncbi:MAG: iron ABC transporter permease [Trueperaceae bacterium]|nr:iron ABC transporter permease [Trueperaceae bacterium]